MTGNHQGTLFTLFFGWAWDQMSKNAIFGPNFVVFGPLFLIYITAVKEELGVLVVEGK